MSPFHRMLVGIRLNKLVLKSSSQVESEYTQWPRFEGKEISMSRQEIKLVL